jgi:hypothetical protein
MYINDGACFLSIAMTHQVLQSSKYLATQYFEKISIALEAKTSEACMLDFFPSMVRKLGWTFGLT